MRGQHPVLMVTLILQVPENPGLNSACLQGVGFSSVGRLGWHLSGAGCDLVSNGQGSPGGLLLSEKNQAQ